mmetsp:Transcript_18890/g.53854  ORF Transcript_18890/g.53854 Transcript_18890/m.53854 type:complete len:233 (+) Transcript_18890:846-1544(+)
MLSSSFKTDTYALRVILRTQYVWKSNWSSTKSLKCFSTLRNSLSAGPASSRNSAGVPVVTRRANAEPTSNSYQEACISLRCCSGSPASSRVNNAAVARASSTLPARNMYFVHLLLMYRSAKSNFRAVSIISAASLIRPAFLRSRAFFSGKSTAVGVCAIARSITAMASSNCPSHSRQWACKYNAQASLVGVVASPLAKVLFDESAAACVFAMSRTFRQHCEPRHRPSTTSFG